MNTTTDFQLSEQDLNNIKKARLVLRAINHKLRKSILDYLHENPGAKVTDLFVSLRLEQSVASQHLAMLRNAGLVTTRREGKFIYYTPNYEMLQKVADCSRNIIAIPA